jgi:hypothetical protein
MLTLTQGKQLGPGDIALLVRDANGQLIDPISITYSIVSIDPQGTQVLVTPPQVVPKRSSQGAYFIGITIPTVWNGS